MVALPGIPYVEQTNVVAVEGIGQVPLVNLGWDDRQTCALALRYQAGELEGQPADYQTCPQYSNQRCTRGGACVFHELDDAKVWASAGSWRLLEKPDGSQFVTLARSAVAIAADLGARIVGGPDGC